MKEYKKHLGIKCQIVKSIYRKKFGLYKSLPILNEPWESVSMDFMTQLLKWSKMEAILVVIDCFSKLAKKVLTKTIVDLAKLFHNLWVDTMECHNT